jgi:hypothetical protein
VGLLIQSTSPPSFNCSRLRDRIAFQYTHGFRDIFGLGLEALAAARQA